MTLDRIHLFDEASQVCTSLAKPTFHDVTAVSQALGRILTRDATARVDVPPFSRAMMDGYAVGSSEVTVPNGGYVIVGEAAAGRPWQGEVQPGQAVRITTGAPLPEGTDTVIRQEWCEAIENRVVVLRAVTCGESVQTRGSDGRRGQVVLPAGTRLSATDIAICRAFGIASLHVAQRPRVAVLVTGDELLGDVSFDLQPGQIYGTNDVLIAGSVLSDGANLVMCEYVPDDKHAIREAVKQAANAADYLVITGGISVGEYDFVPEVLKELGAQLSVQHVLMRPGSPFVAATLGDTPVFALSGNPAACFVQFETLVRPVIQRTLGVLEPPFPSSGKLAHALELKPIKHTRVLRGNASVVNAEVLVDARGSQSPGVISSFAQSNCLIRIDEPDTPTGAIVPLRWTKPLQ